MAELAVLETNLQKAINEAKSFYTGLEAKGEANITAEDRQEYDRRLQAGQKLRQEIEQARQLKGLEDYVQVTAPQAGQLAQNGGIWMPNAAKSWGQLVVESEQYKSHNGLTMPSVDVKIGLERAAREGKALPTGYKALYSTTDGTGGALVQPQFFSDVVDIARQRPRSVMELVNVLPTISDTVEYVRMVTRTNNAAVVPEFTGGNFGLKPESTITFDKISAAVKTIATWVGASRQILQDAPRLRGTIDTELQYMVEITLEDQILNGDGTGSNFLGILNTSGIQTRVMHAATPVGRDQLTTDTRADTLRRAITDIRLAFYQPDAIVLNPADAEKIELSKATTNEYINTQFQVFDPVAQRLWRVPVVETPAITSNTALVGAFRMGATLWDRLATEIRVGEPNDYFLRNAVAILAELRAAFGVPRPLCFEKVTMI